MIEDGGVESGCAFGCGVEVWASEVEDAGVGVGWIVSLSAIG